LSVNFSLKGEDIKVVLVHGKSSKKDLKSPIGDRSSNRTGGKTGIRGFSIDFTVVARRKPGEEGNEEKKKKFLHLESGGECKLKGQLSGGESIVCLGKIDSRGPKRGGIGGLNLSYHRLEKSQGAGGLDRGEERGYRSDDGAVRLFLSGEGA